MELLSTLVKALVMLPIWAVIEAPFIQIAARLLLSKQLSFIAAFLLGVISGVALMVAHLLIWPLYGTLGNFAESGLSAVLALLVTSGIYGCFLTTAEGRSIGYVKGGLVVLASTSLALVAILAIALFAVVITSLFAGRP